MEPLGGSESPTSTSFHTLNLSGVVAGGGGKVLARCRMTFAVGNGVTLELGVRAEKEEAVGLVERAMAGVVAEARDWADLIWRHELSSMGMRLNIDRYDLIHS